jgi:hypothetical protein
MIQLLRTQVQALRERLATIDVTLDGLETVNIVKGSAASAELGKAHEKLARHHELLVKPGPPATPLRTPGTAGRGPGEVVSRGPLACRRGERPRTSGRTTKNV